MELVKKLKGHVLPLKKCCFKNKGDKFITVSYDQTCKPWDTNSGNLDTPSCGTVHRMGFNIPYSKRICTGSFENNAKVWDSVTGILLATYTGYEAEVVAISFDLNGILRLALWTARPSCGTSRWARSTPTSRSRRLAGAALKIE